MKIKLALVSISLFSLTTPAFAKDTYIEAGATYHRYYMKHNSSNLSGLTLRLGQNINDYFGYEVETGFGIGTGKTIFEESVKEKYNLGLYLVGRYPISESFELIGRLGHSYVEIEATDSVLFNNNSDSGFILAIGAQYNINSGSALRIDYSRYRESESDNMGLTYVRKF